MNKKELTEKTLALAKMAIRIAAEEKIYEKHSPEYHEYIRYRVSKFSYNETGVQSGGTTESFAKPVLTCLPVLMEKLVTREEYVRLSGFFEGNDLPADEIPYFLQGLIYRHYENQAMDEKEIQKIVNEFVDKISIETVEIKAIVQLTGVLIFSDAITLLGRYLLRQPVKEDFEFERPIYLQLHRDYFRNPTAFLEITLPTKKPTEVQEEIERAVTILQLFRMGSVRHISYKMQANLGSPFVNSTISTTENTHPDYIYRIDPNSAGLTPTLCQWVERECPDQ